MDVALPEAQVMDDVLLLSGLAASLLHRLFFMLISHYFHSPLLPYSLPLSLHTSFPPYWVTHMEFFYLSTGVPTIPALFLSFSTCDI